MAASQTIQLAPPPPLVLPRALIVWAFFWLVASWLTSIGLQPPLHPAPESYEPGVKLMLLFSGLGLMIGWPLLRLSQERSHWPIRQTVLDIVVLLAMLQVVVWPLRLVTTWTRERTAVIDLMLICWALLAGVMVASAIGTQRNGPRALAMLVCIVLCLGGPAAAWVGLALGVDLSHLVDLSPLVGVFSLGENGGAPTTIDHWRLVGWVALAASLGWIALLLTSRLAHRPEQKRRAGW